MAKRICLGEFEVLTLQSAVQPFTCFLGAFLFTVNLTNLVLC